MYRIDCLRVFCCRFFFFFFDVDGYGQTDDGLIYNSNVYVSLGGGEREREREREREIGEGLVWRA